MACLAPSGSANLSSPPPANVDLRRSQSCLKASPSMLEEKSVKFVDDSGRTVLFELSKAATINFYVEGRQKMTRVKNLYVEDSTIHLDGRKLMSSACSATVPQGEEILVSYIMELFGQRKIEGKNANAMPITVTITSARGLRNADRFSKSDPYCSCEIMGKPHTKFKTRTVKDTLEPQWNHVSQIADFVEGDTLLFKVWDKDWIGDDHLGFVKLKVDQARFPEYEGELRLEEAGKGMDAFLKVSIVVGTSEDRSKIHARAQVKRAFESNDLAAMREAVDAARVARLDGHEYWDIAAVVAKREQALQRLDEACQASTTSALEEALQIALAAGLTEADCDKARKALKLEQQKDQARKLLKEACKECTVDALKAALDAAKAARLDASEYSKAATLYKSELEKDSARRDLKAACEECSLQGLAAAIKKAQQVHLDPSEYAQAKKLLRGREDERDKQRARKQLDEACRKGTADALKEALHFAADAGLSKTECSKARRALELEVQRSEARDLLKHACQRGTVEGLKTALDAAEAAQLDEWEYATAAALLKKATARSALKSACEVCTIEALQAALDTAKSAKLDESEYSTAMALYKSELEKESARRDLKAACELCTIDSLRAAVKRAQQAQLKPSEYALAANLLRRSEEDSKKQKARRQLDEACRKCSAEALKQALQFAVDAGLSEVECKDARRALEVELQKDQARLLLKRACEKGTPEALKAALVAAEAAKLDEREYTTAATLLKKANARIGLQSACEVCTVEALKAALDAAEAAQLDERECAKATALLKKVKARIGLKSACEVCTVEALKDALDVAKAAGLEESEYSTAAALYKSQLEKHDARRELRAACDECTIEGLRAAITRAQQAQLNPSEYAQAERLLRRGEEERQKQRARKQLRDASETYSKQALLEAIENAKLVKLSKNDPDLLAALEALREANKREVMEVIPQLCRKYEKWITEEAAESKDFDVMLEARNELRDAIRRARELGIPDNGDLVQAEVLRKKLHNLVEDLKGAIRVFCRARPLSQKEIDNGNHGITSRFDYMTLEVVEELKGNRPHDAWAAKGAPPPTKKHQFSFNSVFNPGTQDEIFADCADLVQSALDGYNVTLFAYGQTGAGKTYTMFGEPGNMGIGPRSIDEIFALIDKNSEQLDCTVTASIVELYCNELVDLLTKPKSTARSDACGDSASKMKSPRDKRAPDLNIRHDDVGTVVIGNAKVETCRTAADLYSILARGNAQRAVAETAMNTDSSRSHLILFINLKSVNKVTREEVFGKITLCDLAGSERLKKSLSVGERAREATEINKSLTALGDVIQNLTEKSDYVPYRNHKLTQVLQDSLGGSAKTLMVVNCSPANSNVDETLMSLAWATRVNKIANTFNGHKTKCGDASK